jgi:hypothetical protein
MQPLLFGRNTRAGNKCDHGATQREVSFEEGQRLAEDYGVPFIETSAKTGKNVALAFEAAAR